MLFKIKYESTDGSIKTAEISSTDFQSALKTIKDVDRIIYKSEEADGIFQTIKGTTKYDELKHLHNARVKGIVREGSFEEGIIKVFKDSIYLFQDKYDGNRPKEKEYSSSKDIKLKTKYNYSWMISRPGLCDNQFVELQILGFND